MWRDFIYILLNTRTDQVLNHYNIFQKIILEKLVKIKQGNNTCVKVFKFQTSKEKFRNVKKEVCELASSDRDPTAMLPKQSKKVVQVKGYIEKQVLILKI